MESGSNKSLFTLIAVVIFGVFLSLSYWLFQDELKSVLADVVSKTSQSVNTKLNQEGLGELTYNEYTYTEENGEITLTNYKGSESDILLPSYIDGKPVTKISKDAFYSKGLTSIVLPENLVSIEAGTSDAANVGYLGAFADNNITVLTIPSSVKYIGNHAFANNNISVLNIADGVETIGYRAFKWNKLTTVNLPNSLVTLFDGSFGHNQIQTINFGANLKYIGQAVFFDNKIASLTLPESLETINLYGFYNNPLTTVTIPSNVKNLHVLAFNSWVTILR